MNRDAEAIFEAALALSEADRLALVNRLMDSMPDNVALLFEDEDFRAELERRFTDGDEGIPWSQVRDQL